MNTDIRNVEQDLHAVETELFSCLSQDRRTWIQMYKLMSYVEAESLYLQDGLKDFSAWVTRLAARTEVHESVLWARLKAGRAYEEYERRSRKAGRLVPSLDNLPSNVSQESIGLCLDVGGANTGVVDHLMDKVLAGDLKREDLREAARAKRRTRSTDSSEPSKSTEDVKSAESIAAADIVTALRQPNWLTYLGANESTGGFNTRNRYMIPVYNLLTEVAVDSGTTRHARRIDAVAAENMTFNQPGSKVKLHGIEIKVSISDLRNDHKMGEYVKFVDLFWLAVPDTPAFLKAVEEVTLPNWGILAISVGQSTENKVRVVREAHPSEGQSGIMREKTLEVIVLRARAFRHGLYRKR